MVSEINIKGLLSCVDNRYEAAINNKGDTNMNRQNKHTRYSKIHLARRLKKDLTDLYIEGKLNKYLTVIRKYNKLVNDLHTQ